MRGGAVPSVSRKFTSAEAEEALMDAFRSDDEGNPTKKVSTSYKAMVHALLMDMPATFSYTSVEAARARVPPPLFMTVKELLTALDASAAASSSKDAAAGLPPRDKPELSRTTLFRWRETMNTAVLALGRPTLLTAADEENIMRTIEFCDSCGNPQTRAQIMTLATGILADRAAAEKAEFKPVSKRWLDGFFKRAVKKRPDFRMVAARTSLRPRHDCKAAPKLKDGLIQAASLRVLEADSPPAALPLTTPPPPQANLAKRPASPAAPDDNGKRPRRRR
jgi:hypothetical protein